MLEKEIGPGEFLVYNWHSQEAASYDELSLRRGFNFDDEMIQRCRDCGWLTAEGIEIMCSKWMRFVDSSRAAKHLYERLMEGNDVLCVSQRRAPIMFWVWASNAGLEEPEAPEDVRVYSVGKTSPDMQRYVIQEYVIVGKLNG